MVEHQHKGGPDAQGFKTLPYMYLGHNRLSIVDIRGGYQPMEGNRWVLSYNGEIYNHYELRRHLVMHWTSHSDTLTLLNLIEHKGLEWTLQNIIGMYAFAAYDKFEDTVYLCVDPFSIKPLYHCDEGFASSPGALTYLRDKWTLNRDAVQDMLALGATRQPLFDGMHKIPGGHYLKWDLTSGTKTLHKYYELEPKPCAEEELLQAVKDSIQSIRMSDVPIHLFLSGGIDSTVIASQLPYIGAAHLDSPELKYAQEVAKKYCNQLYVIKPRDYNAEQCIQDYCFQSGDCSAAAIIPYIVSKEVSKLGKVAISANGSDELFYGYTRMFQDHKRQMSHIFRPIPHKFKCSEDTRRLELETYIEYDLNKTLDFASMCHGLEVRVPYLNKTVVERAMGYNDHGNKRVLKAFLIKEGFTTEFISRPKMGFSLYSEPIGYETLKDKGVALLSQMGFNYRMMGRDLNYYRAIAGNFYIWHNTWKHLLTNSD